MKKILLLLLLTSTVLMGQWPASPTRYDWLNRPESGEVALVPIFQLQYVSGAVKTQAGLFSTKSTADSITVDWGDDTENKYAGTEKAYTHTYATTGTFVVKFYAENDDESVMTKYTMLTAGAVLGFALSDLPSGMISVNCQGYNTISGNLSDLPSAVKYLVVLGNNTISGNISSLSSAQLSFDVEGLCRVNDYTSPRTWAAGYIYFKSMPTTGYGLSSTEVDNLLIDLAATTWSGSKVLWVAGNNAARTTASDAAKATLIGLGVTVTVNE